MASIAKVTLGSGVSATNSTPSVMSGANLNNSKKVNSVSQNSFDGALNSNQNNNDLDVLKNIETQNEGNEKMPSNLENKLVNNAAIFAILQRPLEENSNSNNAMKIALSPELAKKIATDSPNKIDGDSAPFFAGEFSVQPVEIQTAQQVNNNITLTQQLNHNNHTNNNVNNVPNGNINSKLSQDYQPNSSDINGNITDYKVTQTLTKDCNISAQDNSSQNILNNILTADNQKQLNLKSQNTNVIHQNTNTTTSNSKLAHTVNNNSDNNSLSSSTTTKTKSSYDSKLFQQQLANLNISLNSNSGTVSNVIKSSFANELENIADNIVAAKIQLNKLQTTPVAKNEIINNINVEFSSKALGNVKLQLVESNNALQVTVIVNNNSNMRQINNQRRHITNALKAKGFGEIDFSVQSLETNAKSHFQSQTKLTEEQKIKQTI
ncbi:hypothetical protein AAEX28_14325 [Lentisphaerota bacterium WC36G]|nr:flagellar hook-length control protein FliK [Lentisphaerae bacterium WC36]